MGLRITVLSALLLGFASAGPLIRVRRDHHGGLCSNKCPGDSKFKYSEHHTYVYSYEASNTLSMQGTSELSSVLKATIKITSISKCDMKLEIVDASVKHGPALETSSTHIDALKKHPLHFAWLDGEIGDICAELDETEDVLNIKRGILSAFQNSMKSLYHDSTVREVDVLGSCDTDYKVKRTHGDDVTIYKTKNVASCTNHHKGKMRGLTSSAYESPASVFQHFPFLSGRTYSCHQIINGFIIREVFCSEEADFKPLGNLGYIAHTTGEVKIQMISDSADSSPSVAAETLKHESIAYSYEPREHKYDESDAMATVSELCQKSSGLLEHDIGTTIHKLAHLLGGLSAESVQKIYDGLKSKSLCKSLKALAIFVDIMKASSSEAAYTVLTNLAVNGDLSKVETAAWLMAMPFVNLPSHGAIQATTALLKKEYGNEQAILSVPAMAHKYCYHHPDCESSPAVQGVITSLEAYLGSNCQASSKSQEEEILAALKGFGNLGYVGNANDHILRCANGNATSIPVRIAALDAFRRSPCSEEISSKLIEVYDNLNYIDEVRIAALIAVLKCPSPQVIYKVGKQYDVEKSRQVEAFTYTAVKNLEKSSDPLKHKAKFAASQLNLKRPHSLDITKFSRNYELSRFIDQLNLGFKVEANVIHSLNSFIPRSGNLDLNVDIFGQQLNILEVGMRTENLEHMLEKFLGPRGYFESEFGDNHHHESDPHVDAKADTYHNRLNSLADKVNLHYGHNPEGIYYIRILGNEVRFRHVDKDLLKSLVEMNLEDIVKESLKYKKLDTGHTFMLLDNIILIPSMTGRAYELSANASTTVGLKADGTFEAHGSKEDLEFSLDRRYQPSATIQIDGTICIHSEDYEPGIRVRTTANLGQDMKVMIDYKKGPKLETKLSFPNERSQIFSLKREYYEFDHNGEKALQLPKSHNYHFCTKYIEHVLGIRFCGDMSFPYLKDPEGNMHMPLLGPIDAKLEMMKTDLDMTGYDFVFKLPIQNDETTKEFKLLFDTPNSQKDRKLSAEFVLTRLDEYSRTGKLKFHSPFYTLDAETFRSERPEKAEYKIDVVGDGTRHYKAALSVDKNIRGPRLAEYKPTFELSLPDTDTLRFYGTVVFARGRKDIISYNIESDNVGNHPFLLKGSINMEGTPYSLESEYQAVLDLTVKALSKTYRSYGTYKRVAMDINADVGVDYYPEGKSLQSIKLKSTITKVNLQDPMQFNWATEMLMSEHPQLNTKIVWDFSSKILGHLKNDLVIRYGEDLQDDRHMIRLTQMIVNEGDFEHFTFMDIENSLSLKIPSLECDRSMFFITKWDFTKARKLFVDIGFKLQTDRYVKAELNFQSLTPLTVRPLKMTSEMKLIYFDNELHIRDELQETSPNLFQGRKRIQRKSREPVTIDYTYAIRSTDTVFYHEFDCTVTTPGRALPIHQKLQVKYSPGSMHVGSITDIDAHTSYVFDLKLNKVGLNELSIRLPVVEGTLKVNRLDDSMTFDGDFKTLTRDRRRILGSGRYTPGDPSTVRLEISWDADRDPRKKLILDGKSKKENGVRNIEASMEYAGSINVAVNGVLREPFYLGPHTVRADFSGNIEPMSLVFDYDVTDGRLTSVLRYLRNEVEKVRTDIKGAFILEYGHCELEGGMLVTSPYKAFDGKELYGHMMWASNEATRNGVIEYRIKPGPYIGYVGKAEYKRKRGFPGQVRSSLKISVHRQAIYDLSASADYGWGKYVLKASMTPPSKRKYNLDTTFEYATRYAAFHHAVSLSFQHLHTIRMNAVADFRNIEGYKLQSNFDVNAHKLYDINGTLSARSATDFEGTFLVLGKLVPSIRVFTTTQNANSLTKYSLTVQRSEVELFSGRGEVKTRKKGLSGDLIFSYRGEDVLTVNVNSESKSQREKTYVFKIKSQSKSYTISCHHLKEKKTMKHSITMCRNENDNCIDIMTSHKDEDTKHEYTLTYRRGDIELNFDRIVEDSGTHHRRYLVLHSHGKKLGYDLRFDTGNIKTVSIATILPSREIKAGVKVRYRNDKPLFIVELNSDVRNHPDRTLRIEISGDSQLRTDQPSKLHLVVSHPIFEKPIEMNAVANYDLKRQKIFESEFTLDYSSDPEDKIIIKTHVEKPRDKVIRLGIDVYHQDERHHDLQVKMNGSSSDGTTEFGVEYVWHDDNNAERTAHFYAKHERKERRLNVVYNRPNVDLTANVVLSPATTLHSEKLIYDINIVHNGKTRLSKLAYDYKDGCLELSKLGEQGQVVRVIELCADVRRPVIFSLSSRSLGEEGWEFDYSFEIIRKGYVTLNIRNHWNPEYLGEVLEQLSKIADRALETRGGPFRESPHLRKMDITFNEKVIKPLRSFVLTESKEFTNDMISDVRFLAKSVHDYYEKLPPKEYYTDLLESLKPLAKRLVHEAKEFGEDMKIKLKEFCEELEKKFEELKKQLRERCEQDKTCHAILTLMIDEDYELILQAIRDYVSALPPSIREYVERGGKIEVFFRKIYEEVKSHVDTIMESNYAQDIKLFIEETGKFLRQQYHQWREELDQLLKRILHDVKESEQYRKTQQYLEDEYQKIVTQIQNMDFEGLLHDIETYLKKLQEYISHLPVPNPRALFNVNAASTEDGIIDIEFFFPIDLSFLRSLSEALATRIKTFSEILHRYDWKTILVRFKKYAALDFIPPYEEQAILMGHQHFVTFDKTFYDFAGDCAYVLASDFEDRNFSIILTPNFALSADKSDDKQPSLGIFAKDTAAMINLVNKHVRAGGKEVNLPFITEDMTVTREGHTILFDDHHGLQVRCHTDYEVCTATISGWYYGKTAGLFGTYDYESFNDFRRPKGQIPNSVTSFAKSWDISKGCKTKNLVNDVKIDRQSDAYKMCHDAFHKSTSSLSSCYSEVPPEDYFSMCYRYVSTQPDKGKALCDAAAAYVLECEHNYVELNLPSSCLTCNGPDGHTMKHGDRKKFGNFQYTAADTIFVIESTTPNKYMIDDLETLARSIDKELMNEGRHDTKYGVVSFGTSGHEPMIHTVGNDMFFGINDVKNSITGIHYEKEGNSSIALEAIKVALSYPFGPDAAVTIVLLSSTPCKYDFDSLYYPVVQQILLEHDVILHVVNPQEIRLKKSKESHIAGVDSKTVYSVRDVTQQVLQGEPELRSQVKLPKDACVALSQDVDGSFFSSSSFSKSGDGRKSWRSLFARRIVKTAVHQTPCQFCDCTSTADHVSQVICQPCEIRRPNLPFSVCKSCGFPRILTSFFSYILHLLR